MSAQPATEQKCSKEGSSSIDFQEWWSKTFCMIKRDKELHIVCSEKGLQNCFRKSAL
jgi:hypothetical protein